MDVSSYMANSSFINSSFKKVIVTTQGKTLATSALYLKRTSHN